jgi:hypothetical protein
VAAVQFLNCKLSKYLIPIQHFWLFGRLAFDKWEIAEQKAV